MEDKKFERQYLPESKSDEVNNELGVILREHEYKGTSNERT